MEVALVVLSLVLIGSNVFWGILVHKMINKVMSRDYGQYVVAENSKKPVMDRKKDMEEDALVKMMEQQKATELNRIMGMGA